MILRSRIPLRVSFSGGGTDVDPFCEEFGGSVISCTINKYVHAFLEQRRDKFIKINSFDYNQIIKFNIKDNIAYTGNLRLVKAVINQFKPFKKGFNLNIYCDAPTGSGLGTSGCLGSMLVKLMAHFKKIKISNNDVGKIALEIERDLINIAGGKQDQFAGLYGGFNLLKFKKGYSCKVKKIKLTDNFIDELNYNSLLIYTKKLHYSNDLLSEQIKLYEKKVKKTMLALKKMNVITSKIVNEMKKENIKMIGKSLDISWNLKKRMNPKVTTTQIDKLYKQLKKDGIWGGKLLGAGAGGYMLIMFPFYIKKKIIKTIKKSKMEISNFQFEKKGIKIWETQKNKISSKTNYFL